MRAQQGAGASTGGMESDGGITGSASLTRLVRGSETSGTGSTGVAGSRPTSRASLHAKALVLDGSLLVVGSMNLDLRSQLQNSEVALLIRNRSLSAQTLQLAQTTLDQDAYRITLDDGRLALARASRRRPRPCNSVSPTPEPACGCCSA